MKDQQSISGKRRIYSVLLFFLVFAPLAEVLSDSVLLKNGEVHSGQIIGQDRSTVRLRTANGQSLAIPKTKIKRVTYGRAADEKLKQDQARLAAARREQELLDKRRRLEAERTKQEEQRLEEEQQKQAQQLLREKETREKIESAENQQKTGGFSVDLSALWRSALLPGWGQYYRNKGTKAVGFWAGGLTLLGGSVMLGARHDALISSYEDAVTRDSLLIGAFASVPPSAGAGLFYLISYSDTASTRSQMQTVAGQHRLVSTLGLLFYAYNLIDACCIGGGAPELTGSQAQNSTSGISYNVSVLPERPDGVRMSDPQPTGSRLRMTLELRF